MQEYDFQVGFEKVAEIATLGNSNLAQNEFWNLVKKDGVSQEAYQANLDLLEELLFLNYEVLRILSHLLIPYCPQTATNMLTVVQDSAEAAAEPYEA